MSIRPQFDAEKAVEVLLYIAAQCPDMYTALKVLYFADKSHLARYGRFICGDSYVAMNHGPVPSNVYDIVKHVRGDGYCLFNIAAMDAFAVCGSDIVPLRAADLDFLSESDIGCLDAAIAEYGQMTFGQLRQLSHQEAAFQESDRNSFIPFEAIAKSLPEGELLLEYLHDC